MLAEPRRKQRWVLNPRFNRGKLFTEVDGNSTFGQKMLEKMGWSKGKGLGKKEDGNIDHISVKYKNDSKGIGFQGNDGNWLENQNEFDALLTELGNAYSTADVSTQPSNLSAKSKSSKTRVHYHKMVQGKDLSSRSKEDLQCILGFHKKLSGDDQVVQTDTEIATTKEDILYNSTDSVESYFKKLKMRKKQVFFPEVNGEPKSKKKKKQKMKKLQATDNSFIVASLQPPDVAESPVEFDTCGNENKPTKSKKKRQELLIANGSEISSTSVINSDKEPTKLKKKRKLKEMKLENEDDGGENWACKRRKTDEIVGEDLKENSPNEGNIGLPQLPKKTSNVFGLKRKKKRKKQKLLLRNVWAISDLQGNCKLPDNDADPEVVDTPKAVKKVRFSEEVTVHAVAMHDEVRGGALRDWLNNFEF